MGVQAIVYSVATGRVRRIWDPDANVPNVLAFLAQAKPLTGEAVLAYNPSAGDTLTQWQAAVNAHTGKSVTVGIDAGDTYAIVDSNNVILNVVFADGAIDGTSFGASKLILAPAGCSIEWTYNGTTFTPPVFATKP